MANRIDQIPSILESALWTHKFAQFDAIISKFQSPGLLAMQEASAKMNLWKSVIDVPTIAALPAIAKTNALTSMIDKLPKIPEVSTPVMLQGIDWSNLLPQNNVAAVTGFLDKFGRIDETVAHFINAPGIIQTFKNASTLASSLDTNIRSVLSASILKEDWQHLDNIGELVARYAEIIDTPVEEEANIGITKADLKAFETEIIKAIAAIGNGALDKILRIVTILGFFLSLSGEVRNYLPKPEAATKQDIELSQKRIMHAIHSVAPKHNQRAVTRPCSVHYKPTNRSRVESSLKGFTDVTILDSNHQWVLIAFIDPKDGLQGHGWVMKKYVKQATQ